MDRENIGPIPCLTADKLKGKDGNGIKVPPLISLAKDRVYYVGQPVAFVIAVTMCFLSMMTGVELIQGSFHGWAPEWLTETASQLSMMSNFNEISKGVIDFRNFLYFFSLITMGLLINSLIIAIKKA